MVRLSPRLIALGAAVTVVAAACGDDGSSTSQAAATTQPPATTVAAAATATTMEMMELPASAANMKLAVTSPSSNGVLTANAIDISVQATGFDLACDLAGKPLQDGKGHYHVLLDKSLVDMYCTTTAKISMQNVDPGPHTLEVVPAINDHAEVMDNAVEIAFDYQPTAPLAPIADVANAGTPSVKIISPKAGDVVKGEFDVVVETTNFNNSCDLYGKPGVVGYGHWHVNMDSTTGPMMGMMTMWGMSCTNTFKASTNGLVSGEKHAVIALLVDNGHAPLNVMDQVDVTVG